MTITNIFDIPADQIPVERANLVAEAEAILTRADGPDLTGPDAEQFEAVERQIRTLDHRAKVADHQQALDGSLLNRVLPDVGAGPTSDIGERRLGALPPIQFTEDQIRGLHDEFMSNRAGNATVETRTALTAVPMSLVPQYNLQPITLLRERTRIAQMMPSQEVTAPVVTYYTTTTGATAAATVAEGAAKPNSTPAWTPVSSTIRKIAHYCDVSKEALDDYANFAGVVRDEMTAGLYNAENLELISGSGSGTHLTGLLTTSGILTYAPGSAEARFISIRHAIALLEAAFITPDTIVLNPADAEKFDLTNSTSAGLHVQMDNDSPGGAAALQTGPAKMAWGLKIIVTTQIASGTALVGNFAESTIVFQREPANIFVDPYSQSASNLVRFICEERIGLGVTRPTGLLAITFNGTA